MKKYLLLLIFVFFCILSYADSDSVVALKNEYGGKTVERIFNGHDKVVKAIFYYNKINKIKKTEIFLTEAVQKNNKIYKQIEYYNNFNIIAKFEVFFTEENFEKTGVTKNVEYVDRNDKILKIEYYHNDTLIYEDKGTDQYPFMLLSYYNNAILDAYKMAKENNNNKDVELILFENQIFLCKTKAKILDKIEDISVNDKEVINTWCNQFNKKEFLNYSKKILVEEYGNQYWVFVDDEILKKIKKDIPVILYYYYIGGYKTYSIYLFIENMSFYIQE